MAVLIENIGMPQNCDECPLNSTCGYSLHMPLYHTEKRHDDCPLIEIPEPHGRLIDASEAYDKIAEQEGGNYVDMDAVGMGLDETPTVIPASKEG